MATYASATQERLAAAHPHKTGGSRIWLLLLAGAVAVMALFAVVAYLQRPQPFTCPSPVQCGTAPPVKSLPNPLPAAAAYTSPDFGFSVQYPSDATPSQTTGSSVSWSGTYNEGPATWNFTGDSARARSPQQVVSDVQQAKYPSAKFVYPIPDANLGYTPGYGAVYDLFLDPGTGQATHQRLILIAAVKKGVAVSFDGAGPFVQTSLKSDGHPNPAETPMVHEGLFRQSIEAVTWRGDPAL